MSQLVNLVLGKLAVLGRIDSVDEPPIRARPDMRRLFPPWQVTPPEAGIVVVSGADTGQTVKQRHLGHLLPPRQVTLAAPLKGQREQGVEAIQVARLAVIGSADETC